MSGNPFENTSGSFNPGAPAPQNQAPVDPWDTTQNQASQGQQGFPQQNQAPQGFPQQNQAPQGFPQQNQASQGQQGFQGQSQGFPQQNQAPQGFQQQGFPQQNQAPQPQQPMSPVEFSTGLFVSGGGEYGDIRKENGELLLIRPVAYDPNAMSPKYGTQKRMTLDYVVVTGPNTGRIYRGSFNSSGYLRRSLLSAFQSGGFVLARVVQRQDKDGRAVYQFDTTITDQDKEFAYAAGVYAGFFQKGEEPTPNWSPAPQAPQGQDSQAQGPQGFAQGNPQQGQAPQAQQGQQGFPQGQQGFPQGNQGGFPQQPNF